MSSIILKNATIKNFLSVGNNTQAIDLTRSNLFLVIGNNDDTNGGRNGSGKTTMVQAISYGLFGKPLTRIKQTNLVNNVNKKGMVVTVEFEKDGVAYRIERGQKPVFMRLFVDNKEIKEDAEDETQGENRKTQERINAILGMSHSMFRHIVALNTFTEPFLRMSVGDQRTVIEELLGVTQISERAETLKKLIAQTKEQMRGEEATIRATTEANERIERTISQTNTLSARWEKQKEQALADLSSQLAALDDVDFDAEIAAFEALDAFIVKDRDLVHVLEGAKADLARAEEGLALEQTRLAEAQRIKISVRSKSLQADIDRSTNALARHDQKLDKIKTAIAAAKTELDGADSADCVCCGQPLTGTDHLETVKANLVEKVSGLEADLAREEHDRAAVAKNIAELTEACAAAKRDEQMQEETKLAQIIVHERQCAFFEEVGLPECRRSVEKAMATREALGPKPETVFGSRDELYAAKQAYELLARERDAEAAKPNPYIEQIEALRSTLTRVDYGPLNDLDNLHKHQDFLLRLLTSKDSFIRKRIVEQNIAFLNQRLDHYLGKLGLPHSVRFQSDLSVDITMLGIDMDFEQLSRGEMNRVILSTSWAFRDVWESLNYPINLLFVDELIDNGTDQQGVDAAVEILKAMGRDRKKNVFLISHRDELLSRIDTVLTVTKTNGFTAFE